MVTDGSPVALALGAPATADARLLYEGYLNRSAQSAAALLLVARIARTRFYLPPGMLAARIAAADPVITVGSVGIRFESFSACCGVAARFDVLTEGLDPPPSHHGTTNVDLNGPAREMLSGVHGTDPLRVRVGKDLTISTLDGEVTEAKVPLPERWVRGFAEAQAAGSALTRRAEIGTVEARRLLRELPRIDAGGSVLYLTPGRRGPRLTSTPDPTAVPVGGPSRLRVLEPMLSHATSLTVYGPPDCEGPGVSLWQLELTDARFTVALSPSPSRGFSGEGGLLHDLASISVSAASATASLIELIPDGDPIDADRLAADLKLERDAVNRAMAQLAVNGSVGYDAADGCYFRRRLPWTGSETTVANPRLAAAQLLVDAGEVTRVGDRYEVRHGDSFHRVRGRGRHATCTCPWIARHGTSRGPCKHILATELAHHGGDEPLS